MGLFRLAAVVAVGVSLLPAEREKQEQLYQRAASAATWTVTFCDRNGDLCDKASIAWADFSKKAEFGIKLAYDVVREHQTGSSDVASSQSGAPVASVSFEAAPQQPAKGTLTEHDLKPAWRGKSANKAGI
jgi:hypothetical protein